MCTCVHACVCVYASVHTCVHACVYAYMYVCMRVCIGVSICACVCVHACVCRHVCAHACVCMHVQRMYDVGDEDELELENGAGFRSVLGERGQGAKQGQRDIHMRTAELDIRATAQEGTLFNTDWIFNDLAELILKSRIN